MGWAVLSEKRNNSALRREVLAWLQSGLEQKDGRLALFDGTGQRVSASIQRAAIAQGWAEGWFANPMRPDWMVCRLTPLGRQVLAEGRKAR
ncbi:hypothetical protein [Litorimonas haliclonae]|uniref:hypothetical protein n=1 Tax=Litorimonas haliclonae TaxID=2081977 RepID=UPI0039F138BD